MNYVRSYIRNREVARSQEGRGNNLADGVNNNIDSRGTAIQCKRSHFGGTGPVRRAGSRERERDLPSERALKCTGRVLQAFHDDRSQATPLGLFIIYWYTERKYLTGVSSCSGKSCKRKRCCN